MLRCARQKTSRTDFSGSATGKMKACCAPHEVSKHKRSKQHLSAVTATLFTIPRPLQMVSAATHSKTPEMADANCLVTTETTTADSKGAQTGGEQQLALTERHPETEDTKQEPIRASAQKRWPTTMELEEVATFLASDPDSRKEADDPMSILVMIAKNVPEAHAGAAACCMIKKFSAKK